MTYKNNSKIYGYLSGNELEKYASICKYSLITNTTVNR